MYQTHTYESLMHEQRETKFLFKKCVSKQGNNKTRCVKKIGDKVEIPAKATKLKFFKTF